MKKLSKKLIAFALLQPIIQITLENLLKAFPGL